MKPVKLAYSKIQNAGDLLNEYIFERVFQVPYIRSTEIWEYEVTGIGSFLDVLFIKNELTKRNLKKSFQSLYKRNCETVCVTWGTGIIDESSDKAKRLARNKVEFMAVRGLKSKQCLERILKTQINPVLGDGGILAPMLLEKIPQKKYSLSVIPHFREKNCKEISYIVNKYPDVHVINMQNDVIKVITEIAQSEMILSSSLHGLIIADAFRIPNKRIYFTEAPLGSGIKFDDYYSAYGVMAPAHRIKSVEDVPEKNHILDSYFISDAMVSKMQKDMYHCMNQYLKNRAIK